MLSPEAPFVCYQIMILYALKNRERGFDIGEALDLRTI